MIEDRLNTYFPPKHVTGSLSHPNFTKETFTHQTFPQLCLVHSLKVLPWRLGVSKATGHIERRACTCMWARSQVIGKKTSSFIPVPRTIWWQFFLWSIWSIFIDNWIKNFHFLRLKFRYSKLHHYKNENYIKKDLVKDHTILILRKLNDSEGSNNFLLEETKSC